MANPAIDVSAFISYSTQEKHRGTEVKEVLEEYGIECFLAHEDIQISQEWKNRILEELRRCRIFIPLLSRAFKESDWAPQEIGAITIREDVVIIPILLDGTLPFGFISHVQGKPINHPDGLEELLIGPLRRHHPHFVIPGMIKRVEAANTFRGAEEVLEPLVPLYSELDDEELDALVTASIGNGQVWHAFLCKDEYLPALIRIRGPDIDAGKLRELRALIAR